jgi:predicted AAA+ superfamily ATPase
MIKRWMKIDRTKSALIIGPRRSGKTTYLKTLFPDYTYVTLDDFDILEWAEKDPKGLIDSLGTKGIIDENQRVPKLTIAVKYAIDNMTSQFMMTGSSSLGLLDSSADTLAGRVNLYSMPTTCWGEDRGPIRHSIFAEQASVPILKEGARRFSDAVVYGLFPEIVMQDNVGGKSKLLNNYKNTYFTKDILQLANIENVDGLRAIYGNICRSIGSHLEISHFARESSLSIPTAKKYLQTLYQSELTFKLYGFEYGPAKRYIKATKTYFADNGIMESFQHRLSEGQLLENFVISELEKRRKLGLINADQFYYYKSASGREIDLLFEVNHVLHAIEIKAIKSPSSRDVANLTSFISQTKQETKGYLFYMGEEYGEIGGITLIPVYALFGGR